MDDIEEKERSEKTNQGDECAEQPEEQIVKPAEQKSPESGIRIQLDAVHAMSLPLLTAGYPVIRQMVLENREKISVTGLMLRVISPEGFFKSWEKKLPAMPADTAQPAEIPALVFDAQKMAELAEPVTGTIRAEVISGGTVDTGSNAEAAEEKVLCTAEAEVTYYPFQYWTGAGEYPELLASFLTPDRPALAGVISRAGELLRTWTGDGTMDGYQSGNQDRVIRQVSALYVAVRDHGIRYIHSEPGLGEVPQPVQFAEVTLLEHAGSCLDLVILFASLLEAIHLHPFILQSEGHLFVGFWLNGTAFMPSVTVGSGKAARELNKGIGAAVVFETTLVTKAGTNFELARRTAEMEARDPARPVTVLYDIASIRADGIRPLPLSTVPEDEQPEEETTDRQTAGGKRGEKPCARDYAAGERGTGIGDAEGTPAGEYTAEKSADNQRAGGEETGEDAPVSGTAVPERAYRWIRQLLALQADNPLIDQKQETILPILMPTADGLLAPLAGGKAFALYPGQEEWRSGQAADADEAMSDPGTGRSQVVAELTSCRVRTSLGGRELARAAAELTGKRDTQLREHAENPLYLVFGRLRWFEPDRPERPHEAPLILIPADLQRQENGRNAGFALRLRNQRLMINGVLLTMLRDTFGMQPAGDDTWKSAADPDAVRALLGKIRTAVLNMKQWKVADCAYLCALPYASYLRAVDLDAHLADLHQNGLIAALADGRMPSDAAEDFRRRAGQVPEERILLPMRLEAGQRYVLRAAAGGLNFAARGTKEEQARVLAALITGSIADRSRVLLVSEQQETLQQVQMLLQKLGLDSLIRRLEPEDADKSTARADAAAIAGGPDLYQGSGAYKRKNEQAASLEKTLAQYTGALTEIRSCGRSVLQMVESDEYEAAVRMPEQERILFDEAFCARLTAGEADRCGALVLSLTEAAEKAGNLAHHPLRAVKLRGADAAETHEAGMNEPVRKAAAALKETVAPLQGAAEAFSSAVNRPVPATMEEVRTLAELADLLLFWKDLPRPFAQSDPIEGLVTGVRELCERVRKRDERHAALAGNAESGGGFTDGFFTVDADALKLAWEEANGKFILTKTSGQNRILRTIQQYSRAKISRESVESILAGLIDYHREAAEADRLMTAYRDRLTGLLKGKETDWKALSETAGRALANAQTMDEAFGKEMRLTYAAVPEVTEKAQAMQDAWKAEQEAQGALEALLPLEEGAEAPDLEELGVLAGTLADSPETLRPWLVWCGVRAEAESAGLMPAIRALEAGRKPEEVREACRAGLLTSLIREAAAESPVLTSYEPSFYQEEVRQLGKIRDDLVNLSKVELFGRVAGQSGKRPEERPVVFSGPSAAVACFPGEKGCFDRVLLADADRMKTREAAGLLARGRQAILTAGKDPEDIAEDSVYMDARRAGVPELVLSEEGGAGSANAALPDWNKAGEALDRVRAILMDRDKAEEGETEAGAGQGKAEPDGIGAGTDVPVSGPETSATMDAGEAAPKQGQAEGHPLPRFAVQGVPYRAAKLPVRRFTTAQFVMPENAPAIQEAVMAVLAAEAPISETLLIRRVLAAFSLTRIVSKERVVINQILAEQQVPYTVEEGQKIYWTSAEEPAGYTGFRISGGGQNRRDVGDVPERELENAVLAALLSGQAVEEEVLCSRAAENLGYMTMRDNVHRAILRGIDAAAREGWIERDSRSRWMIIPT